MNQEQQAELRAAVQRPPREPGIELADWHWKVVRRFVSDHLGRTLARSSCLTYLHRLGFVRKHPIKLLLKANEAKRETVGAAYATLRREAQASGAKIFFVDEAHFYADIDLHGTWVLKGTPALVASTSPRYGKKASYYSAVCLETGEVDAMSLEGTSSAETSVTFLTQLRAHHTTELLVIWDNAPAHGGEALRTYLTTPDLRVRLRRLPAYSLDQSADEHMWTWARQEITAKTCFGTAAVRAHVDPFFAGLATRRAEVIQRCRTELQSRPMPSARPPAAPLNQALQEAA